MLCEIPKGFECFFLWHKHLIFKDFDGIIPVYGKTAEAFELLEIAPEVI